jgi:hypothetical protein
VAKGKDGSRKSKKFGLMSFVSRLLASLVMVFATYNPAGFSYFHWVSTASRKTGWAPCIFLRVIR